MVLDGAIPASEGRLWILGQTMPKQTVWGWEIPRYSLFRVDADGLLDSSFEPLELPEYNYYSIAERRGGKPMPGLAKLSLRQINTFEEWLDALFPEWREEDEVEQANTLSRRWASYALGLVPSVADPPRGYLSAAPGILKTFRLPINPSANDADYIVEMSSDLENWQTARREEVAITRNSSGITVEYRGAHPAGFLRVRCQNVGVSP